MRRTTTKQLYNYWNTVRNGRVAPQRFEIEPMKIATLLPETFILETGEAEGCRFRLAGTRICEQFGFELRGASFRDMWSFEDHAPIDNLVSAVIFEGAIATVVFQGHDDDDRAASFEMLLLPLVHLGTTVNRIMGSICAIDAPYWLGTKTLERFKVGSLDLDWPGREGSGLGAGPGLTFFTEARSIPVGDGHRRFRLYQGGLTGPKA